MPGITITSYEMMKRLTCDACLKGAAGAEAGQYQQHQQHMGGQQGGGGGRGLGAGAQHQQQQMMSCQQGGGAGRGFGGAAGSGAAGGKPGCGLCCKGPGESSGPVCGGTIGTLWSWVVLGGPGQR